MHLSNPVAIVLIVGVVLCFVVWSGGSFVLSAARDRIDVRAERRSGRSPKPTKRKSLPAKQAPAPADGAVQRQPADEGAANPA